MKAPIKILYIIDSYKNPYAGTEGQLLKLTQGLDREKFDATFVVFKSSEYLRLNEFPVPVNIVNVYRLSSPLSLLKLFRYFRRKKNEGYHLAHIFFNDASIVCPFLLKLLGYKVIISRRDMGYWYTWVNLKLLWINSLFVDCVIANSEAVKKTTVIKERYRPINIAVIYNGYQDAEQQITRNETHFDISIDEREVQIVLVANIRAIKRISDAIYALNIVRKSNPKVVLYIIGDGDTSQLTKLSEDLDLASFVYFLGARKDVLKLLPFFQVGILCSESEGFSNTLIEYMQSSLPVVCSNVGGNPEIVEHGVNGFLYECGDPESLAKHIITLADSELLREEMGRTARLRVKENYSLSAYVSNHQNLYDDLVCKSN